MIAYEIIEKINHFSTMGVFKSLFKGFIDEREFLILLGVLTFSLGIIGRNYASIITQILFFIVVWFHYCIYMLYFPLFLLNSDLFVVYSTVLVLFFTMQIVLLLLVIWELSKWIEKNNFKNPNASYNF